MNASDHRTDEPGRDHQRIDPQRKTTITAAPCGRDRHGKPLSPRRYIVDARREDWADGRSRVFEYRPDLEVGDGTPRFAPVLVRTDSIREHREPVALVATKKLVEEHRGVGDVTPELFDKIEGRAIAGGRTAQHYIGWNLPA